MRRSAPQPLPQVQPVAPALDPLRARLAGPVDMSGKPLMPNTAPVANGLKKLSVGQALFQRKNGPQASNMIDPRTGQRRSIAEATALMPQGGYRVAGYATRGGGWPRPRIGSAAGAVGSKGTPTSARGKFMRGVREGYDEASVQQGEQAGRDAARAQAGATAPVAAAPVTSTTAGGASTTAVTTSTPWQDRFREYQKKGYSDEYASTYADNDAANDATAQRAKEASMRPGGSNFVGPMNRRPPMPSSISRLYDNSLAGQSKRARVVTA